MWISRKPFLIGLAVLCVVVGPACQNDKSFEPPGIPGEYLGTYTKQIADSSRSNNVEVRILDEYILVTITDREVDRNFCDWEADYIWDDSLNLIYSYYGPGDPCSWSELPDFGWYRVFRSGRRLVLTRQAEDTVSTFDVVRQLRVNNPFADFF